MKLNLKNKDLKITPAIENYLQKKIASLEKFVKKFNQDLIKADAELGRTTRGQKTGEIFRAEINLVIGGQFFRAEAASDNLYAAIDEVRDDLERQIKKFSAKKSTIFIRGARSIKKKFGLDPLARFKK